MLVCNAPLTLHCSDLYVVGDMRMHSFVSENKYFLVFQKSRFGSNRQTVHIRVPAELQEGLDLPALLVAVSGYQSAGESVCLLREGQAAHDGGACKGEAEGEVVAVSDTREPGVVQVPEVLQHSWGVHKVGQLGRVEPYKRP